MNKDKSDVGVQNFEPFNRRSIRLKGYDYSQNGGYFITICTANRLCLFGEIIDGEMVLNEFGNIVDKCWLEIPKHHPSVRLEEYIIMPNHIHGILVIHDDIGVQNFEPLRIENKFQKIIPHSIGSIIRGFKIGVTKYFRQNTDIYNVWQRNYYEQIIKDDISFDTICKYIINNPINWEVDENYHSM